MPTGMNKKIKHHCYNPKYIYILSKHNNNYYYYDNNHFDKIRYGVCVSVLIVRCYSYIK